MVKTDHKYAGGTAPGQDGVLTPEDRSLWTRVTSDVVPLKTTNQPEPIRSSDNIKRKVEKRASNRQLSPPNDKINIKRSSLKHGRAPGLDNRTKIRLRRGQINIESRLDLHGMTQTEAHERLRSFLESCFERGFRSVLVITGKGLRGDGKRGVLKNAVPRWLNQTPLDHYVKAFDYATPRDGGEGALYILLRRRR